MGKPLRLMPVKNTTCSRFARRIGTRLFLVALPAALYACAGAHAADPQPSPSPERIKTVTARRGSVSPTMRISGVVAPYRQFGIATALNEPILEIRVREGERVGAGAVLAVLQTDDLQAQLASAQETTAEGDARLQQQRQQSTVNVGQYGSQVQNTRAAVAQAQSALAGAETDRARYLRLYDSGYLSQQVLAQQNVTIAQDRQAVRAARAQLVQTLQAEQLATSPGGLEASQIGAARNAAAAARLAVEGLRRQIARATIVAPASGVVAAINANVGEYPAGRQLFTIDDDAEKYAILSASSSEALRIRGGESVAVSVPDGTVRAPGRVEAVLDQLSPGSTNYTVKVRMADVPRALRSGMPVAGVVHLPALDGVVVPTTAFTDPMRTAVYVVRGGKARQQTVHDDAEDGTNAVVRGLPTGVRVVTDGQGGVGDGDAVKT